jgi:hypothetical protein
MATAPATAPEVAVADTFVEVRVLSARGLGTVHNLLRLIEEMNIPVFTDPTQDPRHRIRMSDAVSMFTRQPTWTNIPVDAAHGFLSGLADYRPGEEVFIDSAKAAALLGIPMVKMHSKEIKDRGLPFFQFGKGKNHYLKAPIEDLVATNPTFVFKTRKSSVAKKAEVAGSKAVATELSKVEESDEPVVPVLPLPPTVAKLSVNIPLFIPDESYGPDGGTSPGTVAESSQLPSPGDETSGSESA